MKRLLVLMLILALSLLPTSGLANAVEKKVISVEKSNSVYYCPNHPSSDIRFETVERYEYVNTVSHRYSFETDIYCSVCSYLISHTAGWNDLPHQFKNGFCTDCQSDKNGKTEKDRPMIAPGGVMRFSFSTTSFSFPEQLKINVYSGPGMDYYRNGQGLFYSQEFKYGGRIGDWMFVRCKKVDGGVHYGWIYVPQYANLIKNIPVLTFDNVDAVITMNTGIWDTTLETQVGPFAVIQQGTHVTYLGSYVEGGMVLAYVETVISGQIARGFVSLGALQIVK